MQQHEKYHLQSEWDSEKFLLKNTEELNYTETEFALIFHNIVANHSYNKLYGITQSCSNVKELH